MNATIDPLGTYCEDTRLHSNMLHTFCVLSSENFSLVHVSNIISYSSLVSCLHSLVQPRVFGLPLSALLGSCTGATIHLPYFNRHWVGGPVMIWLCLHMLALWLLQPCNNFEHRLLQGCSIISIHIHEVGNFFLIAKICKKI